MRTHGSGTCVRCGQVHAFNNLYVNSDDTHYDHGYIFGLGFEGAIFSSANHFEMAPTYRRRNPR